MTWEEQSSLVVMVRDFLQAANRLHAPQLAQSGCVA